MITTRRLVFGVFLAAIVLLARPARALDGAGAITYLSTFGQTTGATTTQLGSDIDVSLNNNGMISTDYANAVVTTYCTALTTSGSPKAVRFIVRRAELVYRSGNLVLIGNDLLGSSVGDLSLVLLDTSISVSSGFNLKVNVTGLTLTTINWVCTVQTVFQFLNP